MKKLIKIALPIMLIVLLSSFLCSVGVSAVDGNVAVASSEFFTHQGETFTTTIYVPDNANIVDFDLTLKYDTELLTLMSVEENEDKKGTVIFNSEQAGKIAINYTRTKQNIVEYLPILDITFTVDENIGIGTYDCFTVDNSATYIAHRLNSSGTLDIVDFSCDFKKLNIYEIGDVDLSCSVDIGDATYIRRHLAGFEGSILSDYQLTLADTCYDDVIDIGDAVTLQRHLAHLDGLYGNRVNVTFYDTKGNKYASKSVVYEGTLRTIPAVPDVEGKYGGVWSLSADEYVAPNYENLQKDLSVYAYYSGQENQAMDYYKEYLTEKYYSGDLPTNMSSDQNLIDKIFYQSGQYATIIWSSDSNYVMNSTTGKFTKPTYPQNLNLTASITAYDSNDAIDSKDSITFNYNVPGIYITPTKAEIDGFLRHYFTDDTDGQYRVNYDVKLISKLNNAVLPVEGSMYDNFEVRLAWYLNDNGILKPINQIKRGSATQTNDYVAVATFNGKPIDGDGKIYIDDVEVTAIEEIEIKNYIINQIASKQGTLATNNKELWNDDTRYGTTVTWETGANDIAYVENNVIKLKNDAISGETLPLNARISYAVDNGAKEFVLSYNLTVSCDNQIIKAPQNMDVNLYKAIKEQLEETMGYRGDLTSAALASVKFVNLDLSDYGPGAYELDENGEKVDREIISLRGLSYCKNLRTLNISNLRIADGTMNQIATLSYLEAFIARGCELNNLSDGGQATLKNAVNLKFIDLTDNNFTSLNSVFAEGVKYGRLREVYLSKNQLTDINALSRAPMMTYLSLSDNGLTTAGTECIKNYPYLVYLSLANNKIDSVEHLKNLKYLTELRLQNNNISNVNELRRLVNLQLLYIGHNQIKDIGFLKTLTQLEVLYANDNQLFDISALRDLSKLQVINVSNNKLTSLSVLNNYRTTLTEIYAENNNLTDFSFINNATKLHILMLGGNELELAQDNMSTWLSKLTETEILTLSDIKLNDLSFLDGMSKLVRLDVARCGLSAFSGEIPNLRKIAERYETLKILDISDNDFSDSPEEVLNLKNVNLLTVLYADNICDNLDAYTLTKSMTELRFISLENCGVSSLSWLYKYNNLIHVDLAGNNVSDVNLESYISNASIKTLEDLYLDTNVPCTFSNAYRITDFNVKNLSLSGINVGKMEYMPYLDNIEYINLDNTGLNNLTGDDPDTADLYTIERYSTLKTIDVSHINANISPLENIESLGKVYAVGTIDSQRFYKDNLHALQRLYNKGVTCYLYDKKTVYEPTATKEGTDILSLIDDFSCDVTVAACHLISDNNPELPSSINDYEITWTVSDSKHYEIKNNKLAVKDYFAIEDDTLTVTATIKVYEDQATVSRDFTINTHILRASDRYLKFNVTGYSENLTRDSQFTYGLSLDAAETDGFKIPVFPVEQCIKYSFDAISANENVIPWENVITDNELHGTVIYSPTTAEPAIHNITVKSSAPLGAKVNIKIDVYHMNENFEKVYDIEQIVVPLTVASRTFTANFVLNGGTLVDRNGLPRTSGEYIEDSLIFEGLTLTKPGYIFEGWYLDESFTDLFSADGSDAIMPSREITLYAKWKALSYNIIFDANGGELQTTTQSALSDVKIGELPVPTRTYYTFDGWFTATEGGEQVTAESKFARTDDLTLYAHWTLNSFVVTFNANGGSVDTNELRGYCGKQLGILPTPTRDYYTFAGWYTDPSSGELVTNESSYEVANDITLYAHWTINKTSGWVLRSELPEDAEIVATKYSYTLRSYSESDSSTKTDWVQYDTKRISWGSTQGPVYSDPSNGARNVWSESYVSGYGTTYYYHYYKYGCSELDYSYSYSTGGRTYYDVKLTYKPSNSSQRPVAKDGGTYKWYANGTGSWAAVYYASEGNETDYNKPINGTRWYYQEPIYKYYYYRDDAKESTSYPSGENVSNIVEWVQYRKRTNYEPGVVGAQYEGHIYKLIQFSNPIAWHVANDYCKQVGGHLVTITSVSEQNFVAGLGDFHSWIGGYRASGNQFAWVTGEPFNYSNWRDGEPNNTNNCENYIGIYPDHGWNDYGDTTTSVPTFIIEFE